jgi:hypothetical protein
MEGHVSVSFALLKELIMERNFLDVLSHLKCQNDKPSIEFVRYVMLKYFDEQRIFMPIKEAMPFLEESDRKHFAKIMKEVPGP